MAKREDFFERAGRLTLIQYAMRISMAKSIAGGAKIATIWPMGTVVSMRVCCGWIGLPNLRLSCKARCFQKSPTFSTFFGGSALRPCFPVNKFLVRKFF